MQPFLSLTGRAAFLPMANVDTDVIMPKEFLKGIDRAGLDRGCFHHLRFDETGQPRREFVLNRPEWKDARVLVVGPNFGCGSSREHAVWGLLQLGIRALIGTSFAGIFADNAANNGLLAVTLPAEAVAALGERAADPERSMFCVDLEAKTVTSGEFRMPFEISAMRRASMMQGLDAIGTTLQHAGTIRSFQDGYLADRPWLR